MAIKTLLDVAKETAYSINVPAPTALFGSSQPSNLQWLHLLYEAGEWIRDSFDYPTLKEKYTFATVSGQKFYPLPGHFWRLLHDTQWDDTNEWALFGPVQDGKIAARDKGTTLNDTQYVFRVAGAPFQIIQAADVGAFDTVGAYIEISPVPNDVRTLSIEFIQANWFFPRHIVEGADYNTGDIRSANRQIWIAKGNFNGQSGFPTAENDDWKPWKNHYNVITNDGDYPIVDPHTLRLALRASWMRSKGQDHTPYEAAALSSVKKANGRFQGIQSVASDGDSLYEFPWVSEDFVSTGF